MAKYGKTLLIIGILFLVGNLVWFFYEYVKLGPRTYNRLQNAYWNITFTPSYIALGRRRVLHRAIARDTKGKPVR